MAGAGVLSFLGDAHLCQREEGLDSKSPVEQWSTATKGCQVHIEGVDSYQEASEKGERLEQR